LPTILGDRTKSWATTEEDAIGGELVGIGSEKTLDYAFAVRRESRVTPRVVPVEGLLKKGGNEFFE